MGKLNKVGAECYAAMLEASGEERGYRIERELARLNLQVAHAAVDGIDDSGEALCEELICTLVRTVALCHCLGLNIDSQVKNVLRRGAGYWD